MPQFTTRVELYGTPSNETYNLLHSAMAVNKFSRNIKGTDGKIYELPHAVYYSYGNLTCKEVMNLAINSAKTVWKDFAVVTTITDQLIESYNLKPAKQALFQ
jgi:hypothetical protein